MLKAFNPRSLVSVTVFPLMDTMAMSFTLNPLSHVTITKYTSPHSVAIFDSFFPFTIIYFTICPMINTFPVGFSIKEVTFISISIRISFKSFSLPQIVLPLSLINSILSVDHDTPTHSSIVRGKLSSIHRVLVLFNAKVG